MPARKGNGITHMESPAQVSQALRPAKSGLRFRCRHTDEVGRRYGTDEVPSHAVGEQERLIELTGAQPRPMQWNGHNDVDVEILRQRGDHQRRQRGCEAVHVSVFESADGLTKRRNVWVQGPGAIVGGRTFDTGLASVGRRPGIVALRDEWSIAVRASGT